MAASLQMPVEDIAEVDANPEIIGQPPARGGCWLITREEYDVVKHMIRGSYMPWYLLELPNGQWGALWVAGLQIENAGKILLDDYSGLAFTGTQDGAQKYIHKDLTTHKDECQAGPHVKPIEQMFRSVKPGRQARAPKWKSL